MLVDQFGRNHNYLRVSLTERCNLRCTYCMPAEGIALRERSEFMSQEEMIAIVGRFVNFGVDKIRLTGGEPLIKKNFSAILNELSKFPVDLAITTNGVLLDQYIDDLKKAGLNKINISLDSLQEEKFNRISRRFDFKRIMENIQLTIAENFNVKINVVLMQDENIDEIVDFILFTKDKEIEVRFIEFMPFNGNEWDWSKTVSSKTIQNKISEHFGLNEIETLPLPPNSTTRNYKIKGFKGQYGIISSVTNPFCDSCNRIRLTADGKVKNCLFSNHELNLLEAYRHNENIDPIIQQIIHAKKEKRAGIDSFESESAALIYNANRSMTTIGG